LNIVSLCILMVESLGTAPRSRMCPRCFNVYRLYINIKDGLSKPLYYSFNTVTFKSLFTKLCFDILESGFDVRFGFRYRYSFSGFLIPSMAASKSGDSFPYIIGFFIDRFYLFLTLFHLILVVSHPPPINSFFKDTFHIHDLSRQNDRLECNTKHQWLDTIVLECHYYQ